MSKKPRVGEDQAVEITDVQAFSPPDDNAPLWPDGPSPTIGQVREWKHIYGKLYVTEYRDDDDDVDVRRYIWRQVTRQEYREIMSLENVDTATREEILCERIVLWPQGYNRQAMAHDPAGVPSVIADQALIKSGFAPSEHAKKL